MFTVKSQTSYPNTNIKWLSKQSALTASSEPFSKFLLQNDQNDNEKALFTQQIIKLLVNSFKALTTF